MNTRTIWQSVVTFVAGVSVVACTPTSSLNVTEGMGPNPVLPAPKTAWIPTIEAAKASRWPEKAAPAPADVLAVNAFARGLDHPRWLYVLPNGDVLVAETNAPSRPNEGKGIEGQLFKF